MDQTKVVKGKVVPPNLTLIAATAQAWVEASPMNSAIIAENLDGVWSWFTQYERWEFLGGSWQARYRVRYDAIKRKAVFKRVRG